MARAIWKGSISFGLVAIPVELHVAVREHRPRVRLLQARDKSPVKYERVCLREGRPMAWEDLVKGYEGEVVDLMERLRRSLETAGKPRKASASRTRKPAGKKPGRAA